MGDIETSTADISDFFNELITEWVGECVFASTFACILLIIIEERITNDRLQQHRLYQSYVILQKCFLKKCRANLYLKCILVEDISAVPDMESRIRERNSIKNFMERRHRSEPWTMLKHERDQLKNIKIRVLRRNVNQLFVNRMVILQPISLHQNLAEGA